MKKLLFIGVLLATSAWGQYVPTVFTPNAVGTTTLVKVGTFTKTTTTCVVGSTCPLSQAVNIGVDLSSGKAVLMLWAESGTAADNVPSSIEALALGWGITTATNGTVTGSYGPSWFVRAGNNSATTRYWGNTSISSVTNGSNTIAYEGTVSAFTSTGFTVSWTTQSSASADRLHYKVIYGSNLTSAKVVECTMPTSTGDSTCNGLGFQPTFVMLMSSSLATAAGTAPVANAMWTLGVGTNAGAACANAHQWTYGALVLDLSGTNHMNVMRTDKILEGINSSGVDEYDACLKTMAADGATFTFGTAPASAYRYLMLGMAGPQFAVGAQNKPTSLTTPVADSVSGLAFQPKGGLMMSNQGLTSTSVQTGYKVAIGAFDSSLNEFSYWAGKGNNQDAGDIYDTTSKLLTFYTCGTDCAGANLTLNSQTAATAINSDGIGMSWTANTANAYQLGYAFIGN